jgi:hypothetical protein
MNHIKANLKIEHAHGYYGWRCKHFTEVLREEALRQAGLCQVKSCDNGELYSSRERNYSLRCPSCAHLRELAENLQVEYMATHNGFYATDKGYIPLTEGTKYYRYPRWTHAEIVQAEHDLGIHEGFIHWNEWEVSDINMEGMSGNGIDPWEMRAEVIAEILDTPILRMEAIINYLAEKRGSDG